MVFSELNQAQKASLLDFLLINQRDTGLTAESYTTLRIRVDKFLPGIEVVTPTLTIFDDSDNVVNPTLINAENLALTMACSPYYNIWEMKGSLNVAANVSGPKFKLSPLEANVLNPGLSVDNISIEQNGGSGLTLDKDHFYVTYTGSGAITQTYNAGYGRVHGTMSAGKTYEIFCGPMANGNSDFPAFIAWTGEMASPTVLKRVAASSQSFVRCEYTPDVDCEFYAVSKGSGTTSTGNDITFPTVKIDGSTNIKWYSSLTDGGIVIQSDDEPEIVNGTVYNVNARGLILTTELVNYSA